MSVHSNGTGSAWLTSLDVDQPHGLDYREFNDIRLGIGKRIGKQHVDFADATVGGEHIRGGSSILDIVDASTDISAADGTYVGGGLIYSKGVNSLWCFTTLTEYTNSDDAYELKFAPRSICRGADWTWTGDHAIAGSICVAGGAYFDSSVDISGNVVISAAITTGSINVDGTIDLAGKLKAVDISASGALYVDASVDVSGDVAVSGGLNVSGDVSMADISGTVKQRFAFAWASFCSNGNDAADADINSSYNVNKIYKISTGIYEVSFSTAASICNYCAVLTMHQDAGSDDNFPCCGSAAKDSLRIRVTDDGVNYSDPTRLCVAVFGY